MCVYRLQVDCDRRASPTLGPERARQEHHNDMFNTPQLPQAGSQSMVNYVSGHVRKRFSFPASGGGNPGLNTEHREVKNVRQQGTVAIRYGNERKMCLSEASVPDPPNP